MQRRGSSTGLFIAAAVFAVLVFTASAPAADLRAPGPGSVAGASTVTASETAKTVAAPQPPVQISADEAVYFNKRGLAVFTGHVVVAQEDSTITAERMDVSFEKREPAEGLLAGGIGAPSNAQRITKIVAQEKVSFRQIDPETKKERYATGDKGVYDVEQRTVTMSGNPRLWEGNNVIVGEEMVFHLEEKRVVVKGKVNLKVYPDDLKEGKKP